MCSLHCSCRGAKLCRHPSTYIAATYPVIQNTMYISDIRVKRLQPASAVIRRCPFASCHAVGGWTPFAIRSESRCSLAILCSNIKALFCAAVKAFVTARATHARPSAHQSKSVPYLGAKDHPRTPSRF